MHRLRLRLQEAPPPAKIPLPLPLSWHTSEGARKEEEAKGLLGKEESRTVGRSGSEAIGNANSLRRKSRRLLKIYNKKQLSVNFVTFLRHFFTFSPIHGCQKSPIIKDVKGRTLRLQKTHNFTNSLTGL